MAEKQNHTEQNEQGGGKANATSETHRQYAYCDDPCYCKIRNAFWRSVWNNAHNLNFWVALGTWALAFVAYLALHAASKDSRTATIEANRAWVSVSWGKDNFVPPNFIIGVQLANTGREPATDVAMPTPVVTFPYLSGNPLRDKAFQWPTVDTCEGVRPIKHGLDIFPAPADVKQELISKPVTAADITWSRGLRDGSRGMFVVGCVAYITFGRPHHTQYCFLERKMEDGTVTGTNCKIGGYAN